MPRPPYRPIALALALAVSSGSPLRADDKSGKSNPPAVELAGHKKCAPAEPCPEILAEPSKEPPPVSPPPAQPTPTPTVPSEDLLSSNFGSALDVADSPSTLAPFMIGDSQGGGCGLVTYNGAQTASVDHPTFLCSRTKIAENNSPIPRDRVYTTYQYFQNTTALAFGSFYSRDFSINKFTFGAEKTFFGGMMSVELRIPFASQLTNNIAVDSTVGQESVDANYSTQFGNVAAALKVLAYQNSTVALSGGVLVHAPTAPRVLIRDFEADTDAFGAPQLIYNTYRYENQSVLVSPFIGGLWTPTDRIFVQGFNQYEIDTTGSTITFTPSVNGVVGTPVSVRAQGQALMRLDVGGGYWLYRNPGARGLTGVAGVVETHYTYTLDNAVIRNLGSRDPDDPNPVTVGNIANRQDIWNLTLGPTFMFGQRAYVNVGSVIPLSTGDNRSFNYELNLQGTYRF